MRFPKDEMRVKACFSMGHVVVFSPLALHHFFVGYCSPPGYSPPLRCRLTCLQGYSLKLYFYLFPQRLPNAVGSASFVTSL